MIDLKTFKHFFSALDLLDLQCPHDDEYDREAQLAWNALVAGLDASQIADRVQESFKTLWGTAMSRSARRRWIAFLLDAREPGA